jgi:lipoic acid synthetase
MILGDTCTRGCRFCAVKKGKPSTPDLSEPERLAKTARNLNLSYVVVTSVTRDDLDDGGAGHFVKTISALRKWSPHTKVEILTPDFNGSLSAIHQIIKARPDIFNHNVETVPRLYHSIRPVANYSQSLDVLSHVAKSGLPVKSGLMLGLGETDDEIETTLKDINQTGCRYLTLGQYLAPSNRHVPVVRYLSPEEFEVWAEIAEEIGFTEVASAPLVRSSYRADQMGHAA